MDRSRTQKRGGGIGLPMELPKTSTNGNPHHETPERILERRWAHSLLERVVAQFVQHERLEYCNRLKLFLHGQPHMPYSTLAREMVADPADVEPELRSLAAAPGGTKKEP